MRGSPNFRGAPEKVRAVDPLAEGGRRQRKPLRTLRLPPRLDERIGIPGLVARVLGEPLVEDVLLMPSEILHQCHWVLVDGHGSVRLPNMLVTICADVLVGRVMLRGFGNLVHGLPDLAESGLELTP